MTVAEDLTDLCAKLSARVAAVLPDGVDVKPETVVHALMPVLLVEFAKRDSWADRAEAERDAVVREVTETVASFRFDPEDPDRKARPDYVYGLGRMDMGNWVEAALKRAREPFAQVGPPSLDQGTGETLLIGRREDRPNAPTADATTALKLNIKQANAPAPSDLPASPNPVNKDAATWTEETT